MAQRPKIFYAGKLPPGSTTLARLHALEALGCEIMDYDVSWAITKLPRLERTLLARRNLGRTIPALNKAILQAAENADFDLAWIDKGVWIYPQTVRTLKQRSKRGVVVHYTPDSQFTDNRSRHFFRSVPHYDLLVTTKTFEIPEYHRHGANDVILVQQGYGARFANADKLAPRSDLESDISFIGHCQPHYARLLERVAQLPVTLKIWGPHWTRFAKHHAWAARCVQSDGLWEDDYPRALRSTKIALGLLSKRIPETTTTRTFEIPATGTFMLAERTPDHEALFADGQEAAYFDDADDLVAKIGTYLANDTRRTTIAAAGRQRCLTSGYSLEHQLERVIANVL